ncbi:MAG: hypothetical protein ACE5F1_14140 [Planctomycetota bacterium]
MRSLLGRGALAALLALTSTLDAQCKGPRSVKITSYGKTCLFFNQPGALSGSYDSTSCTLTLTLTKARTCCNTFPSSQLLMLGVIPISPGIQHPLLVRGCVLSLLPVVILSQPASRGPWRIPLPPVTAPITIYVQGVNDYFTTIGLTHDYQSSNALRLVLS